MKNPIMVGLAGFAGSGKDTVADLLVEMTGRHKMGFADPLRDAAYALNPWIVPVGPAALQELYRPVRYANLIDTMGYENGKRHPVYGEGVRELLQRLGTEVGRRIIDDDVWVNIARARALRADRVVFSDVRFANEAEMIKRHGGVLIRIERDGIGPANDHVSESPIHGVDFDYVIYNRKGLAELRADVMGLVVSAGL